MKWLFYVNGANNRKNAWNGDIIRYGGVGVSGTDQSYVYFAEQLVGRGDTVDLCAGSCLVGPCRGVNYIRVVVDNDYDGVVVNYPNALPKICFYKVKRLYVYFQCNALYAYNLVAFKRLHPWCEIVALHVSEFGKRSTRVAVLEYDYYFNREVVVNNPVFMDVFEEVCREGCERVRGSFVFHAVWERGGVVAEEVYRRLGWTGGLFRADYDSAGGARDDVGVTRDAQQAWEPTGSQDSRESEGFPRGTRDSAGGSRDAVGGSSGTGGSLDKLAVARLLARGEYFVYPLINSNPMYYDVVHKDTFGCCVSEALAMGVIVVTWRVAALAELYTDEEVLFVDFPSGANVEKLVGDEPIIIDATMRSEEAIQAIVKAIMDLEEDIERKKRMVECGIRRGRGFGKVEWVD